MGAAGASGQQSDFLTAHADFEYMKEAISLQSFDYILQPAEKTELKNVVGRAKSQIAIEKKNKELLSTGAFFKIRKWIFWMSMSCVICDTQLIMRII